ncbi:MAG: ATP-dependent sacrificial sulfur transferase LarE [Eubacterium sp.]|nr:ATP-dependent sacrificial sulfur transferase LarE [Eubacterium sp.]
MIDKYNILKSALRTKKRLAIALSGGVDSVFLLFAAKESLPAEDILAVTAKSVMFPSREMKDASEIAEKYGITHMFCEYDPFTVEGIEQNPSDRCYMCKKALFQKMTEFVKNEGDFVLCDGTNADDEKSYRPGIKALDEARIFSPLREYGFTKDEIRKLSKILEIPTWDKPSCACLATRVPYGEQIGESLFSIIDEAENFIIERGFKQVRVRAHGTVFARIELDSADISKFIRADIRFDVYEKLRSLGFAYVTLDVLGYRQGSFDEYLSRRGN